MNIDRDLQYSGKELEVMSFAQNYHRWIIDQFEPYLGERVAEVGAGIGNISRIILTKSVKELFAFEPSSNLFPSLFDELKHEERAHPINDFFSSDYLKKDLDSIVYVNVLEHIEEDQTELTNLRGALGPNGRLLLFVPALRELYSDFDRSVGHYRRYEKNELKLLVEKAGFKIVQLRYFDFFGVFPWYLNFVLLRKPMNGRTVFLYDNYIVPIMKLAESYVTPPIGKNLFLVGMK